MNGEGKESEEVKMEVVVNRKRVVFMWGYLPGDLPQRSPLLSPVFVPIPASIGCFLTDVCGGGCGFAMAISGFFFFLFVYIDNFREKKKFLLIENFISFPLHENFTSIIFNFSIM